MKKVALILVIIVPFLGCSQNSETNKERITSIILSDNPFDVIPTTFHCTTQEFIELWNASIKSSKVLEFPTNENESDAIIFESGATIEYDAAKNGLFKGFILSWDASICSESEIDTIEYIATNLWSFISIENRDYDNSRLITSMETAKEQEKYDYAFTSDTQGITVQYIKSSPNHEIIILRADA